MKINLPSLSKALSWSFIICVFTLFSLPGVAQVNVAKNSDKVPPPAQETFSATDAVASPWRVGYCPDQFYKITDCHELIARKAVQLNDRIIYNDDGSVWYSYEDRLSALKFYRKDFLPFAGYGDFGRHAILKMFAESEHWYEVEINAKTHATRFILKSDPNWQKTTWDFWLAKAQYFGISGSDETEIFDRPGGEVITRASESKMTHLRYLGKRDGDWAHIQVSINGQLCYPVEKKSEQCYPGWIRWRQGQNTLLRTRYNYLVTFHVIPEIKDDKSVAVSEKGKN